MLFFEDLTIVVPAYNRVKELDELLESVAKQTVLPRCVLVVEDCSAERDDIREMCSRWREKLVGVKLTLIENEDNLGFDKNIRKCIESCSSKWAMLMGNDDVLLSNAVEVVQKFVSNNNTPIISRSFMRFNTDVNTPLGVSAVSQHDAIFRLSSSNPKYIFRSAAFIGGLVFDVGFCKRLSTDQYDGSLYYQIYLAAEAFCGKGIGYISTPIVGGRAGNPPMFGSAANEKGCHVPGGYTAQGRASMWKGVLSIVSDVGERHGADLVNSVRRELTIRQSFHVFEMNAGANRQALDELKGALEGLGLFSHVIPKLLYCINVTFGAKSKYFYDFARRIMQ